MKNRIGLNMTCEARTGMAETTKSPLSGKKAALAAAVVNFSKNGTSIV